MQFANLESVVRPHQSPLTVQARAKIAVPPSVTTDSSSAHICWGQAGTMPTAKSTGTDFTTCNDKNTEVANSRKTDKVKISDPNNSNNYIMVDRANEMQFTTTNKPASSGFGSSYTSYVAADIAATLNDFAAGFSEFDSAFDDSSDTCKLTVKFDNGKSTNENA